MKNLYILLVTLLTYTFSNAQIVDIPDANFKDALVNHNVAKLIGSPDHVDVDTNNDGEIQVAEAENVYWLEVHSMDISSLEGIQSFINIEHINFQYNQVSEIDLSQNSILEKLYCGNNQLISIDITQNQSLKDISIWQNQLTSLDVTQNLNLERISCYSNQINSIDVTNNINLITLILWINQITSLNISQNPNLIFLSCSQNQIANLDISQNTILETLYCSENQLVNLNLNNGNNNNMVTMFAYNNPNLNCIQVDDVFYANNLICDFPYASWCKDDWAEYSELCELGTEDNTHISVTIYPNPVQDVLRINTQQPIESLKIYNLQGQLIKEDSNSSVDVSQLTAGLYFIQLIIDGKTVTKKFIKE